MVAFAIFIRRGTIPWPCLRAAFSVSDRRNEFPAREILQPFENQYGAITLWHSVVDRPSCERRAKLFFKINLTIARPGRAANLL